MEKKKLIEITKKINDKSLKISTFIVNNNF